MSKINFQLFANDFEGIDEDIQKELIGSAGNEQEKPKEDPKPNAEADSDNKEVKVEKVEKEKPKVEQEPEQKVEESKREESETGNIPYSRFKEVNEKRKSAEAEVNELKKKLEEFTNKVPKINEQKKVDTKGFVAEGYNQEQMEKITAYAIEQVKKKSKLSDEDVEAIRYGDDNNRTLAFNASVQSEINSAIKQLQDYRKEQESYQKELSDTTKEFGDLNDKLMAYPDKDERFKYLTEEAFSKLPERKQMILNRAFLRLQNKKGTYQDMELVNDYFNKANTDWEKSHEPKPAATAATKFEKAQGLPKASNINGGANVDSTYSMDDIRAAIESGDTKKWDALPEKVRQDILSGTVKL